jgi:hypothetical protein
MLRKLLLALIKKGIVLVFAGMVEVQEMHNTLRLS